MLVDQYYANVLALLCVIVESFLDLLFLGLVIAYQEVTLRVRRICDMANTSQQ